jgi:cytolysin-activating lysine-acyltransferase
MGRRDFITPMGGATAWASVSDETHHRLSASPGQKMRLRPDEWKSGEHLWIIDVACEQQVIAHALHTLARTQFKETPVRLAVQDAEDRARVEVLQSMLTPKGAGDGAS